LPGRLVCEEVKEGHLTEEQISNRKDRRDLHLSFLWPVVFAPSLYIRELSAFGTGLHLRKSRCSSSLQPDAQVHRSCIGSVVLRRRDVSTIRPILQDR